MEMTFDQGLHLAARLCEQGVFNQAADLLTKLLGISPNHPDALFLRGHVHLRTGEIGPGIERMRRAVGTAPHRSDLKSALCGALFTAGDIPGLFLLAADAIVTAEGKSLPEALYLMIAATERTAISAPPFAACRTLVAGIGTKPGDRLMDMLAAGQRSIPPEQMPAVYLGLAYILHCGGADDDAVEMLGRAGSALEVTSPPPPSETNYADLAATYDDNSLHRGCNDMMMSVIEAHLPAHVASILDACCGTGLLGTFLRPRTKYLSGFDLSAEMLDLARARSVYDSLTVADASSDTAVPAGPFDAVVSSAALHHIEDLRPFISNAARRLRSGGYLIFSTEATTDRSHRGVSGVGGFAHSRAYLLAAAEAAGLETISISLRLHRRYPGFYAVFRRP
ncbi:class I SAM-dependent DNA methyltransferase [Paramagnetospirillum magneticum]|uniref:class I SAM-dependent DNA methyltransferase n=1 Tax=Paramagnetospirillum magneticum TaxID=84159 RepID=UPI0013053623|nr:methyltransferase domain-containing protein [Paramagnetospirillum magneticum]